MIYLNIDGPNDRTGTLSSKPGRLYYTLHIPEPYRNEIHNPDATVAFSEGDFIAHKDGVNTFFGQIIAIRHDLDLVLTSPGATPSHRGAYGHLRISELSEMQVIIKADHILKKWAEMKYK